MKPAHLAIVKALQNGSLQRGRCWCGEIGQAHHEDYEKPLEVEWLCHRHHVERHGKTCHKDKPIKIADLREYHKVYDTTRRTTPEGRLERQVWRLSNPEKIKEYGRRHYAKHREKLLKQCSQYARDNQEKVRAYQAGYRARKREERQAALNV